VPVRSGGNRVIGNEVGEPHWRDSRRKQRKPQEWGLLQNEGIRATEHCVSAGTELQVLHVENSRDSQWTDKFKAAEEFPI
jgi:hypothetical protein